MNEFLTHRVVKATFDATGGKAIATYSLPLSLPDGAIVKNVYYNVTTTFTSAGADAGTLAISVQSAGDATVAIAISDASNVWDAGLHGTLIGSPAVGSDASTLDAGTALIYSARFAASLLLLTADRVPTIAVAGQALTAGVLEIYFEYVV